jgi:hypothetical protein
MQNAASLQKKHGKTQHVLQPCLLRPHHVEVCAGHDEELLCQRVHMLGCDGLGVGRLQQPRQQICGLDLLLARFPDCVLQQCAADQQASGDQCVA